MTFFNCRPLRIADVFVQNPATMHEPSMLTDQTAMNDLGLALDLARGWHQRRIKGIRNIAVASTAMAISSLLMSATFTP